MQKPEPVESCPPQQPAEAVNEDLEKMVRILCRVNPEASIESIRAEASMMIAIEVPFLPETEQPESVNVEKQDREAT